MNPQKGLVLHVAGDSAEEVLGKGSDLYIAFLTVSPGALLEQERGISPPPPAPIPTAVPGAGRIPVVFVEQASTLGWAGSQALVYVDGWSQKPKADRAKRSRYRELQVRRAHRPQPGPALTDAAHCCKPQAAPKTKALHALRDFLQVRILPHTLPCMLPF